MTDNWKQNKSRISWTIRRRGQYEREEHFSKSSIIWIIEILCCCWFYAWWYSTIDRSVPFTEFHAPKQPIRNKANPILSRDTWKTLNRAFGRDRVGIELIQDIVFWKDHPAVILETFSSNTEPIWIKLHISLLWENISVVTICELMIVYVLY